MTELIIDELARQAGTTSRNVRAYQERGLLPPPRLKGRTGYYNEGHLARLRHIGALLERGYSLAAIRGLLDAWERGFGLSDVLGFQQAVPGPRAGEPTARVTRDQLADVFGDDPRAFRQAVRIGLLEPDDDGYRVTNPRLLETARRLTRAGVPVRTLLAEAGHLMADLDQMAERWVGLFKQTQPTDAGAMAEFLDGMREVVGDVITPLLAQAVQRQAEAKPARKKAAARR